MNTTVPKVFISYSWSNSDRVLDLAQRLMSDGIDVVLDVWELKEGQDKYAFMERSVTDESISKVLMICDKQYAEKANNREGGVGDETMVISPEVYAKATETKYLPVIFERSEDGKEYVPAYLKTLIYFDLSNDDVYEKNYESLIRNIHNKPQHSKPVLGKMPEYLNEESVSLSAIRGTVKQIQTFDGKNQAKISHLQRKFNDEYVKTLIEFVPQAGDDYDDRLLRQIDATKPLRDLYYDYIEALILGGIDISNSLGGFFEQLYNGLYATNGRNSYRDSEFEFGFFLVWEMFVGTTAILLHYESYKQLRDLLERTYFLNSNPYSTNPKPSSYIRFRHYCAHIEKVIKPKQPDPRLHTLTGDIASKREKLPILSTKAIANADVVLYQLSDCLEICETAWSWYPTMYVYLGSGFTDDAQPIWKKMISKRHCESLFPLFGVTTTAQLIEVVKRNKADRSMGYRGGTLPAPTISFSIKPEVIATLP
jgi:hypothetical protein